MVPQRWCEEHHQAAEDVSALRDGLNFQRLLAPDEIDRVATIRASFVPYVELEL